MSKPHYASHEEVHASIEIWCNQAAELFIQLTERLEALENQVDDLTARVKEWEVGTR